MPYIYHTNQPNVGKYTSPMDGMGNYSQMPFPKQCCGAYSQRLAVAPQMEDDTAVENI